MFIVTECLKEDLQVFSPAPDDLAEAKAAGVDWYQNLLDAENKVCIRYDLYRTLCIGGNKGDQVWFVMDNIVEALGHQERLCFRKAIINYRNKMLETYPVIWNFVWTGNKSHYRFLKSIGAEFHEEFTESPLTGERFQLFTIRR